MCFELQVMNISNVLVKLPPHLFSLFSVDELFLWTCNQSDVRRRGRTKAEKNLVRGVVMRHNKHRHYNIYYTVL